MDPNFNNLTDVQQKLHNVEYTGGKYKIDKSNPPQFIMGCDKDRFSYYSYRQETMSVTHPSKSKLRFSVSMVHHWLQAVEWKQKWPELRVLDEYKDEIQICWTHNPGTNCFSKMEMKFSVSKHSFILDNPGIDVLNEVLRTKNTVSFQQRLGNIEAMESWSSILYENTTNPIIPWWFTRGGTALAFPIYYYNSMSPVDEIFFECDLRDEIVKLLRMRRKVGDRWKIIKPDLKYISGFANPPVLPSAELVGHYVDTLQDEVDDTLNRPECNNKNKTFVETYKIEDIITINSDNTHKYGMTISEKPSNDHPARIIVPLAENVEAQEFNLFSNYSTDPENVYTGSYPISEIKFRNEKTNNEEVYDLDGILSSMNLILKETPITCGYPAILKTLKPTDLEDSNGISLSNNNIKISITLGDTSIARDQPRDQLFRVKIRIIVARFITFHYDYTTKKYKWTIDSSHT